MDSLVELWASAFMEDISIAQVTFDCFLVLLDEGFTSNKTIFILIHATFSSGNREEDSHTKDCTHTLDTCRPKSKMRAAEAKPQSAAIASWHWWFLFFKADFVTSSTAGAWVVSSIWNLNFFLGTSFLYIHFHLFFKRQKASRNQGRSLLQDALNSYAFLPTFVASCLSSSEEIDLPLPFQSCFQTWNFNARLFGQVSSWEVLSMTTVSSPLRIEPSFLTCEGKKDKSNSQLIPRDVSFNKESKSNMAHDVGHKSYLLA